MSTTTASDLRMTRTYNAPLDLVWEAWSDAQHLLKWWGPDNFPVTSWEHEFVTGGAFAFVMEGPGGMTASSKGTYEAIEPKVRIVQHAEENAFNGEPGFATRQIYAFRDNGDATTGLVVEVFILADDFPEEGKAGMEQGWNEQLDKLGRVLS